MADAPKQRAPVTLTPQATQAGEGFELLRILEEIMEDGRVTDEEVLQLQAWLDNHHREPTLPGSIFLHEEVMGILQDGMITGAELTQIKNAILRVLPKEGREKAKEAIAAAKVEDKKKKAEIKAKEPKKDWTQEPATDKQLSYIRALGGKCPPECSKGQAGVIINELKDHPGARRSPTTRQQMVLCFWDKLDLMDQGPEEVSAWMDEWHIANPKRLEAWELWKMENGDIGGHDPANIEKVQVGIGQEYLERVTPKRSSRNPHRAYVEAMARQAALMEDSGDHPKSGPGSMALWLLVVLVGLGLLVWGAIKLMGKA